MLTKITSISLNIKFYARSASYLVERFQNSIFVALQWFLCLCLQDSLTPFFDTYPGSVECRSAR